MVNEPKNRARSALIYDFLLHYATEEFPVPRDQLLAYLDCERKTLAREIIALRKCGFPICSRKIGKQLGYYLPDRNISLGDILIWIDEDMENEPSEYDENTTCKDQNDIGSFGSNTGIIDGKVLNINREQYTDTPILQTTMALQYAIQHGKKASFLYYDWNENHERCYKGNGKRYQVQPIGLVHKDCCDYLMVYQEENDSIAQCRLDKIDDAIVLDEEISRSACAARKRVADIVKQPFKMYGGETGNVTLQFTHDAINDVFDKFGKETHIEKTGDDQYETTVEIQINTEFWGWMFQAGDMVQVIAPEIIIKEYKNRISMVNRRNRKVIQSKTGEVEENEGTSYILIP